MKPLSRRRLLSGLGAAASAAALPPWLSACREAPGGAASRRDGLDPGPRFLIVVAAAGGASIVDSFLAVRASESPSASTLNTFPDGQVQAVEGSPFRAVKVSSSHLGSIPVPVATDQLAFVRKHAAQMLVASTTGTSVNHVIAQKRSLTGNGAWRGRTLQECVAAQWGAGVPLPNVNMSVGGFAERGTDDELPPYAFGELVANPSLWPLGLDGARGIQGAPPRSLLEAARATRDGLDRASLFGRTFVNAPALARWNAQRGAAQRALEAQDLITRLNVIPDLPPSVPLGQYGLGTSADGARLRQVFPAYFTDPVEGQAALAFLLLKHRVSVTVTIGPSFNVVTGGASGIANPPLAFDFSHNEHRAGQAFMWARVLGVVDRLVDLLKAEPYDATSTLWDRSLIYVATDFGRTRTRPPDALEFGSGHDLNNGVLLLSPLVRGNTVLGGVDPATTLTHGFDARTGTPLRGKQDANEADVFSGVLTALGVDTSGSGLPDASAFRRG